MARYDRIARIDAPAREDAFSGWLTLRDLEGREREPELGRRASLHFLALRPVRRLLTQGLETSPSRSLDTQIEQVRQQVDALPADHASRDLLTRYLEEVGGRSLSGMARATLDVGAAAEAAGHSFAAEEFYRTALELAEAHDLDDQRVLALRHLARVQRERGEWDAALESLERSAALADSMADVTEWARSTEALAAVHLRRGDADAARAILTDLCGGSRVGNDAVARAVGQAGLCALELREGNLDTALEAGWAAVRALQPGDEARNRVLLNMAAAFRRLGLLSAAASCYEIVVQWAAWPEHRIEARLEHTLVAADSGDEDAFISRRAAVLDRLDHADRPLQAMVHLGLGRGALLVGEVEDARAHIHEAIATARDIGAGELLDRAERLLHALHTEERLQPAQKAKPVSAEAAGIAGRITDMAAAPAE